MKKLVIKILLTFLITSLFLGIHSVAFADNPPASNNEIVEGTFPVQQILAIPNTDENGDKIKDKEGNTTTQIDKYIKNKKGMSAIEALGVAIIDYALRIMGSIAMILIIIAGFLLITARGDSGKIDEAKEMIQYVIIGLVIAFLAYIILLFVQSLFPATAA